MTRASDVRFRGECMGVGLRRRGGDRDPHVEVVLEVEDDGVWHEKQAVSSHWLDELIHQLQQARAFCATQAPDVHDGKQYGWRFRDGGEQ